MPAPGRSSPPLPEKDFQRLSSLSGRFGKDTLPIIAFLSYYPVEKYCLLILAANGSVKRSSALRTADSRGKGAETERRVFRMKSFDFAKMAPYTGRPGFAGRFIHTEGATVAHWEIRKGTPLADHSHPHEQVTVLLSGKLELHCGGESRTLSPGQGIDFAGGEPHGGTALEDCLVMDVFCPPREDFKKL